MHQSFTLIYKISLLFIFQSILYSCNNSLIPEKYISYIEKEENGLFKIWEQNDIQLSCQYMPVDYLLLKQTEKTRLTEESFLKTKSEIEESFEFKLKFKHYNSSNFLKSNNASAEEYHKRSMYLSYDINKDLNLIIENDTLNCRLSHHERTYGNTPYETILISFPKLKENTSQMTLVFNDRVFGLGKVNFRFLQKDLDNIPTLNLKNY